MRKSFWGLLFFVSASVSAQQVDGLFVQSMESYRSKATNSRPWTEQYNELKTACLLEANGAGHFAEVVAKDKSASLIDRAKRSSRGYYPEDYSRSQAAEALVKYAVVNKKLTPEEFGPFIGAACMISAPVTTRMTRSFLRDAYGFAWTGFDGKRATAKMNSIAMLLNMDANWLQVHLDTVVHQCNAVEAPAWLRSRALVSIDDQNLEGRWNCYLSQLLESPINASAFLMNVLYR